jgi:hypothetical protein
VASLENRLKRLEGRICPRDPEAEREWQQAVELLDLIAAILANNPRWDDVAAQVAEHRPELDAFAAQLEVKRILIASDPRGGPELAEAFVAGASEARRNVGH